MISPVGIIGLDLIDLFFILGVHGRVGVPVLDVGPGDGGVESSVVNRCVSYAAPEVVSVVHLIIHFIWFTLAFGGRREGL